MKRIYHPWVNRTWPLGCVLCLAGLLLLLGCIWGSHPAQSQTSPDPQLETLQYYQQELQQQQKGIQQQRRQLNEVEQAAQQDLLDLEVSIYATDKEMQDAEYRLERAEKSLQYLEDQMLNSEQRYQAQQSAIVSHLRWLQKQPRSRGWAVLLQSRSINEFLGLRYRMQLLYAADRQKLADLQTEAATLQARRLELEQQKNNIALVRQRLQLKKADYYKESKAQQATVQRLKDNQLALAAAQAQLDRDSRGIRDLIRQRMQELYGVSGSPWVLQGNGGLLYPVYGPISSVFGWRQHPIFGTQRLHAGIDFAVDYGTPITAAAPGEVIFAGWYGGYGNAVIIDHGSGITTLYAHASQVSVSQGDRVPAGQIVATVGSTGFSTGPHLHFEVREDGEPVDPMNYL